MLGAGAPDDLSDLAVRYSLEPQKPGEWTIYEIAAKLGISVTVARHAMVEQIAAGNWAIRETRINNRKANVYWRLRPPVAPAAVPQPKETHARRVSVSRARARKAR